MLQKSEDTDPDKRTLELSVNQTMEQFALAKFLGSQKGPS